jgi:hypothetical protein
LVSIREKMNTQLQDGAGLFATRENKNTLYLAGCGI